MKKTMPKPVNWQDFESLCKKLWGEIWGCDNIKKNGRAGQTQHGVDVYGMPDGRVTYYGIQCKGKDDYTNVGLTKAEIDEEINKAKNFNPKLGKFIFATTANKDATIEEYVRIKNQENVSKGDFGIDIYSWEDIVDLIEEHKQTYDWYLKDVLHKTNNGFLVEINGEDAELELAPVFVKTIVNVRPKLNLPVTPMDIFSSKADPFWAVSKNAATFAKMIMNAKKVNHSLVELKIRFFNTGDTAIEHYKVIFSTDNHQVRFKETNYKNIGSMAIVTPYYPSNYFVEDNEIVYRCSKERPILVPEDGKAVIVYIDLPKSPVAFDINYRMLSRYYTAEGKIRINSNPQFDVEYVTREANDAEQEGCFETITVKEETVQD